MQLVRRNIDETIDSVKTFTKPIIIDNSETGASHVATQGFVANAIFAAEGYADGSIESMIDSKILAAKPVLKQVALVIADDSTLAYDSSAVAVATAVEASSSTTLALNAIAGIKVKAVVVTAAEAATAADLFFATFVADANSVVIQHGEGTTKLACSVVVYYEVTA